MTKLKAILILITIFSQSIWALSPIPSFNIDATYSGSWYNPQQSGHGLSIEVLANNTTVIYWYVYNPDGTPTFLITIGQNQDNTTSGDTYIYSGMKFGEFNPNDLNEEKWGTVSLTFYDCGNAELNYSSTDPQFGSSSIPMSRLAWIKGNKCTDSPMQGNYSLVHHELKENGDIIVSTGYALLHANGDMAYMLGKETLFYGMSAEVIGVGTWFYDEFEESYAFNITNYPIIGSENPVQTTSTGFLRQDGFTSGNFEELMTATYLRSSQNNLTTETIAGTYGIAEGDAIFGELIIASDGKITGDFGNCQLEGQVQVPDTDFNQAGFYLDEKNCENPESINGVLYKNNEAINLIGFKSSTGIFWSLN